MTVSRRQRQYGPPRQHVSQMHQGHSGERKLRSEWGFRPMNSDLEAIVVADEEARARVEAARRSAEARIAAAREEVARSMQDRTRAREAEIGKTLRSIGEEAERQAAERLRRREEYLAGVRRAAQEGLATAAEAWARIVRDGPAGKSP